MATQDHGAFDRRIDEQDGTTGHQADEWVAAHRDDHGSFPASAQGAGHHSVPHLTTKRDNVGVSAQDGGGAATALQTPSTAAIFDLTAPEWRALCALRARYRGDRDLFSGGELARLRFVRWLYQTGRLMP